MPPAKKPAAKMPDEVKNFIQGAGEQIKVGKPKGATRGVKKHPRSAKKGEAENP